VAWFEVQPYDSGVKACWTATGLLAGAFLAGCGGSAPAVPKATLTSGDRQICNAVRIVKADFDARKVAPPTDILTATESGALTNFASLQRDSTALRRAFNSGNPTADGEALDSFASACSMLGL
jgi:hypothetical protein